MHISLAGKRAIVTAGCAGIGRAIVEQLVESGARVVACDISDDAISGLAHNVPKALGLRTDVSSPDEVEHMFQEAERHLGGLDILVNNAGISGPTLAVEDVDPADWARTMDVNVTGAFLCTRRAASILKKQQSGVIINMSSTAGRIGMPFRAAYSSSKFAIRGLTDAMAIELGEFGIRVNAVLPGLVDGPRGHRVITEQAAARGLSYEEYLPSILHNISLHVAVSPKDVAAMVTFLVSDLARHVSGQSIGVCGNFESYRAPMEITA